eukprot:jgi/Pico_ML_1/51241/g191.t2
MNDVVPVMNAIPVATRPHESTILNIQNGAPSFTSSSTWLPFAAKASPSRMSTHGIARTGMPDRVAMGHHRASSTKLGASASTWKGRYCSGKEPPHTKKKKKKTNEPNRSKTMKTSVLVATMALAVFGAPGSDALLAGLRRNNEAANAVKPELECKIYRSTPLYEGMFAPAAILQKHDTVAKSVINVPDAFDVKQVLVGVNVTYTRPAMRLPFSRMREAISEFRKSHDVKRLPFQVKLAMWEFAVVKKFVWLVYLYKTGKLATLPSLKDFDFKTQLPGLYDYLDEITADFNGLNFRLFSEAEAPSPEEGMDLDEVMFR